MELIEFTKANKMSRFEMLRKEEESQYGRARDYLLGKPLHEKYEFSCVVQVSPEEWDRSNILFTVASSIEEYLTSLWRGNGRCGLVAEFNVRNMSFERNKMLSIVFNSPRGGTNEWTNVEVALTDIVRDCLQESGSARILSTNLVLVSYDRQVH